jgi:hypothetical protein
MSDLNETSRSMISQVHILMHQEVHNSNFNHKKQANIIYLTDSKILKIVLANRIQQHIKKIV